MTHMVFADTQWFKPTTEKDVTAILDANKGKTIRFLLGNTAKGNIISFSLTFTLTSVMIG
jgi:hypothetical protein